MKWTYLAAARPLHWFPSLLCEDYYDRKSQVEDLGIFLPYQNVSQKHIWRNFWGQCHLKELKATGMLILLRVHWPCLVGLHGHGWILEAHRWLSHNQVEIPIAFAVSDVISFLEQINSASHTQYTAIDVANAFPSKLVCKVFWSSLLSPRRDNGTLASEPGQFFFF